MQQSTHSYEEIYDAVVDLLLGEAWSAHRPTQFNGLLQDTARYFANGGRPGQQASFSIALHPQDQEFVRDVFWDLFRLGYITLGINNSNPEYPWFRLSHRGQKHLQSREPWKFHDTTSYFTLLKNQGIEISEMSQVYLDEALQSFYAQCPLAACVMLGVAAEAEFDAFIEVSSTHSVLGDRFQKIAAEKFIAQRIKKFRNLLGEIRSEVRGEVLNDVETHLNGVQLILRIARNETGHPTAAKPSREQVYVYFQIFVPFAKKLKEIRDALSELTSPISSDEEST